MNKNKINHNQDTYNTMSDGIGNTMKKIGATSWLKVIAVLVLIYSASSLFFIVDEGHVGIIKRFGEATSQVEPGLHFKVPIMDSVERMEVRTRNSREELAAATSEQMPVKAEVSVNWTVHRAEALSLYKRFGGLDQFEERILNSRLRSAAKTAIAKYKAEKIIQSREEVIGDIERFLTAEMEGFPVSLDNAQLENVVMPAAYLESIQTKQTEKNLAEAEEHKLKRQELTAQQEVNTANAKRDSMKAMADGQAYQIEVEAKAQADAIQVKGLAEAKAMLAKAEAIRQSATLVDYEKALRWDGAMPTTVMGGGQSVLWNLGSATDK